MPARTRCATFRNCGATLQARPQHPHPPNLPGNKPRRNGVLLQHRPHKPLHAHATGGPEPGQAFSPERGRGALHVVIEHLPRGENVLGHHPHGAGGIAFLRVSFQAHDHARMCPVVNDLINVPIFQPLDVFLRDRLIRERGDHGVAGARHAGRLSDKMPDSRESPGSPGVQYPDGWDVLRVT